MSPFRSLKNYLDDNGVTYEHIVHSEAFTAQEKAALSHTSGKERAKSVIVWGDGKLSMIVIPAHKMLDMDKVKGCIDANVARLARENEFAHIFSGCELGALPIFGNLYDMPVFVDRSLEKLRDIYFTACTHHDTVRITFSDFTRLAQPTLCDVACDDA